MFNFNKNKTPNIYKENLRKTIIKGNEIIFPVEKPADNAIRPLPAPNDK